MQMMLSLATGNVAHDIPETLIANEYFEDEKGATPLEEVDTDGLDVDISLPSLVWDNSDQASLISEQQANPSLCNIRK